MGIIIPIILWAVLIVCIVLAVLVNNDIINTNSLILVLLPPVLIIVTAPLAVMLTWSYYGPNLGCKSLACLVLGIAWIVYVNEKSERKLSKRRGDKRPNSLIHILVACIAALIWIAPTAMRSLYDPVNLMRTLLLAVIPAGFIGLGFWLCMTAIRDLAIPDTKNTKAKIVEIDNNVIKCIFTYKNEVYRIKSDGKSKGEPVSIGDEIDIHFYVKDPNISDFGTNGENPISKIIAGIIVLAIGCTFAYIFMP